MFLAVDIMRAKLAKKSELMKEAEAEVG